MKLINEERVTASESNKAFRSFGFIEDDEATIAAYSIHMSHPDRPVSIILIIGEWGDYSKGADGRIAIFADFYFGLEYGFVFSDPSEEQVSTSRILASKALSRNELINSKDIIKYKEILDIIYLEELKLINIRNVSRYPFVRCEKFSVIFTLSFLISLILDVSLRWNNSHFEDGSGTDCYTMGLAEGRIFFSASEYSSGPNAFDIGVSSPMFAWPAISVGWSGGWVAVWLIFIAILVVRFARLKSKRNS